MLYVRVPVDVNSAIARSRAIEKCKLSSGFPNLQDGSSGMNFDAVAENFYKKQYSSPIHLLQDVERVWLTARRVYHDNQVAEYFG